MKMLMLLVAITFGSLVSFASLACGGPDSTTHVGELLSVDKNGGQFTIHDVMLDAPISFVADDQMLSNLESVIGMIQVDFEKQGNQLRALEFRQ